MSSRSQTLEQQPLPPLTRYPSASLRELFRLSLPLILVLLSSCLMGFCDRLFLAHYSLESFEGCVNAVYLCSVFQLPCIRISSMAQIFVGFHKGAHHPHLIGPCIWQMIWFSFLSMLITLPLGLVVAPFFIGGTTIEQPAMTYFHSLMSINFLFPLAAALSSFYIADGRTKPLIIATLVAQGLNILFDYLLIFGIPRVLPPQGIFGAALATGIAQGSLCAFLLMHFLQKRFRDFYSTHKYAFHWSSFYNYVQVGIPRAIARMILLVAWAAIVRIITLKGGDYLIVLSVGGTLFLLFSFINEGMGQGIMTVASRLIGAKEYAVMNKLKRSSFLFLCVTMGSLTLPFFIFPEFLLSFFFTEPPSTETLGLLLKSCHWLWFLLICNGINMIGFSFISAACDTVFHMMANCLVWLTSYLPVYLAFGLGDLSADIFWIIVALDSLIIGLILLGRAHRNSSQHRSFEKCHTNLPV